MIIIQLKFEANIMIFLIIIGKMHIYQLKNIHSTYLLSENDMWAL